MRSELVNTITSTDPAIRNRSLDAFGQNASLEELLAECQILEQFRKESDNLYERVRALFFLYALHRFHLPMKSGMQIGGRIPFDGYQNLLSRRFEEAIGIFLRAQATDGISDGVSSALAAAYRSLGFQTLADQVRRSVRSARGNQWMFRTGHPADHPLRVRPELAVPHPANGLFPILFEATPVRMDLTHSCWSDIFFLGMDFPEGARVLNTSINLSVRGAEGDAKPRPPVEAYVRVIDRPLLRLVSVDLGASAEISTLAELFDFAKDYLGLLKAAVIASGIVPPGMEGARQPLAELLARVVTPGHGLEIVSCVNGIPKGSRLAVSTTLLACLITACMRATGQTHALTGMLSEEERRLVAARAILGEWLAGSGGGWQDSGGVWPGMKLIEGVRAKDGDPEFGVSRGCLLPRHRIISHNEVLETTRQRLQDSLVLVHGGMAQDVGPILEMVTEKYLLRSDAEWQGRLEAITFLDQIVEHLRQGNIAAIGSITQRNFDRPIQTIVPWASNLFTESLIAQVKAEFGKDFFGFWMIGGMSGGGMGFIFDPKKKPAAQERLQPMMSDLKRRLEHAVPFAIEPVVYDFTINEHGTYSTLLQGADALMPQQYYTQTLPAIIRVERHQLSPKRRAEIDQLAVSCREKSDMSNMPLRLFDRLLPRAPQEQAKAQSLDALLEELGFDRVQHEQIRSDLRNGRIGLAQNRLPVSTHIENVAANDICDASQGLPETYCQIGLDALASGSVAVVSLAGGAGSRWTHGAGVVKALNPFCKFAGKHRTFIEIHLAKSRLTSRLTGTPLPHVITTSYLTHEPIERYLQAEHNYGYAGPLYLSPGRSVGLRLIPMARDLRFAWEEMPQQLLDEQAQKVRESLYAALIDWAQNMGEGSDYRDNLPLQCLHPVGHWYEAPNLLRNGVLSQLLEDFPNLRYLMVHNIDTLGTNINPTLLGYIIEQDAACTMEVITRHLEDRGGGLARINGQLRLVEGLSLPREEVEFDLSYYNTNTAWINVPKLLELFELTVADLSNREKVTAAVRRIAAKMPTYITLKDVKKRWGKGQEDIFPLAQFEKLWCDMTGLPEFDCRFIVVSRRRGQQLKEPAQLDGWLRDGSAAFVNSLCEW
ncbi:UTP--glucose-1-phosphate uridylyltransferase-like protein [Candidatus Moduliflexus flocculans]|uniref:UTP--glucose-1-phosphate uridylyltransferase-like protein n=1 Tax=Candidatus Moduliflexus flocculans TaxID=1499966 RepID=A0A0S6W0V4_9BACT|nr:UTP--glucose-1-phosphate uridylyltransferase-like protein [Candidatus Moduliflexus flocculans]